MLKEWKDNADKQTILDKITLSDEEIQKIFQAGNLSRDVQYKLHQLLKVLMKPLAIRSSGLLEDSQSQPFAGIYKTYMIPNNNASLKERHNELMNAVKLVFSSVFLKSARQYIRSINFKVEDEKMAVIIQEVVGSNFDDLYYPHISGVAQSYNYYPTAHLKNKDGIATIAVGLGKAVVDGETNYIFCPIYPKLSIISTEKMIKSSQKELYALNLSPKDNSNSFEEDGVSKIKIRKLRNNGSLANLASIWDYENDILKMVD